MQIFRCELTLLENTFFSSREIGNYYQTEPVLGNYALCYALGLAVSSYNNQGEIHYAEHLGALNQTGIYVTPAQILGQPRFKIEQFNAMPDSYWYAMGNNALITKPDGWDTDQSGSAWYIVERATGVRKKIGTGNRPQIGRVKMLGIGNHARFYLISANPLQRLPSYVRLGKWNSKAKLKIEPVAFSVVEYERQTVAMLLNPVDFAATTLLHTFDMISIHPAPLIRNALVTGKFYQLADPDKTLLPTDMRFGVEDIHRGR